MVVVGFLCLSMLFFSFSAHPIQNRSVSELSVLKQKISSLQKQIKNERENESEVITQLDTIEQEIATLSKEQSKLKNSIESIEKKKALLNGERGILQRENTEANDGLRRLLRSSYMLKRQGSMKLFFNQQDPASISQSLALYRYLIDFKNQYLQEISTRHKEIDKIDGALVSQEKEAKLLLQDLEENQRVLTGKETSRKNQLLLIQAKLLDDTTTADLYDKKEEELLRLLGELGSERHSGANANATSSEMDASVNRPFRSYKGELDMPLRAPIRYRFGQKQKESDLIWDGLTLAAKEGQQVTSIYAAQVVYADWFRGYGQLIILDHGDGFMSLYGHNQLLYVALGDTVKAGGLIAKAGTTGGLREPGLYFEIRDNGVPVDPLIWCKR